jgi:glutamate-1-semialdehyde 2,1-aminomutase
MAAGLAALKKTAQPGFYEELDRKGAILQKGIESAARNAGISITLVREGSLFWIAFQPEAPRRYEDVGSEGVKTYGAFHQAMLGEGVYLAPSGYEVGFLSSAHSEADLETTIHAAGKALQSIAGNQ